MKSLVNKVKSYFESRRLEKERIERERKKIRKLMKIVSTSMEKTK